MGSMYGPAVVDNAKAEAVGTIGEDSVLELMLVLLTQLCVKWASGEALWL